MQITHKEARRLIQFKADNGLSASSDENLNAHLKACTECRAYSDSLKDTESVLRQTMHKQWGIRPLPIQMNAIYAKVNPRGSISILVTTRTTLIGIAFVMFAFITWQSITNNTSSLQPPLGTPGAHTRTGTRRRVPVRDAQLEACR